jgi:CubicO group peptidase (beta-lactamase class C family)
MMPTETAKPTPTEFPRALLNTAAMPTVAAKSTPVVDLSQEFPHDPFYNQNKGAEALIKYASSQPEIHAFLLLQHVEIVAEYYDPLFDESTQFFTWSCTKSWLSLLFGIMQDEGDIEVTVALGEIWPDDYVWNGIRDGEARKAITIESLLTHTSGLQPR